MRICTSCGEEKQLDQFYQLKSGRIYSHCKLCTKIKSAENYKNHKEARLSKRKEWREKNREKENKTTRMYWNKRYEIDSGFRMKKKISNLLRQGLRGTKTKSTFKYFNYTFEELKNHLESLFQEGMTWDNYGDWHIDHIIPRSNYDHTDVKQVEECWSLQNLQPLWAKDNLKKGNKIIQKDS